MLLDPRWLGSVASTGALSVLMDERQYDDGADPCLTAATSGELVHQSDAGSAGQWPLLAAAAREHGVGSSLGVPVTLPEPISAGLNLYSLLPDGFAEHDVELARTLAAYAAVALTTSTCTSRRSASLNHLERALESRGVIDQAKGILMAQRRCTADEAFRRPGRTVPSNEP